MGSGNKKRPGVDFSLEEDAEEIFRQFIEENEPTAVEPEVEREPPSKRSRRKRGGSISLDLHGMTLAEAKEELRARMEGIASQGGGQWEIRVITGKGRHSGPGGGVLVREIYDFFSKTYRDNVIRIDTDPSKSLINGIPIRGHFDVTVKY